MTPDHWLSVLARIAPGEPVDLDARHPRTEVRRDDLTPWDAGAPPPSARLWERADTDVSYLGVRVDTPLPDPERAALRLASAALERSVTPIILSSLDSSGFERFGFRIERYVGGTEAARAAWEAEMTSFWGLALIIDVTDVSSLD